MCSRARKLVVLIVLLCCAGCATREPKRFKVVDAGDFRPVRGAKVWMQPFAPIHPFWPPGDRGVTDENGEVTLLLPEGFWFYFHGVEAGGYAEVKDAEELKAPPGHAREAWPDVQMVFFMRRTPSADAR